jgi:hypothetical protein
MRSRDQMKNKAEIPQAKSITAGNIRAAFLLDDWRQKKRIKVYGELSKIALRKLIRPN